MSEAKVLLWWILLPWQVQPTDWNADNIKELIDRKNNFRIIFDLPASSTESLLSALSCI